MNPVAEIHNSDDIVQQFAAVVRNKDYELLGNLLADVGTFNNRKDGLHLPDDSSKANFMDWFIKELSGTTIEKVEYNTCNECSVGNLVVLVNDGQFPASKPDRGHGNNSISAMMLGISDRKINQIRFCNEMAESKSKFWYEKVGEEIMEFERETGVCFDDAFEEVLKRYGQWHESMRPEPGLEPLQIFKPKPVPTHGPLMKGCIKVNIRTDPDWKSKYF